MPSLRGWISLGCEYRFHCYAKPADINNSVPSYLNIRRGAYLGLILSIAMCPWQLLSSASTFISVLSGYSVFLGPWVGIMVCDYWIIRRQIVKLSDLYSLRRDGIYQFWRGFNWRAYIAWFIGFSYLLPGFAHAVNENIVVPEACTNLYYLAFPLGFTVSFCLHWLINAVFPPAGLGEKDEIDNFMTFTAEEAAKLGVAPHEIYDGMSVREEIGVVSQEPKGD